MDEVEKFEGLVEVAKEVEENALDHVAYSGPLDIKRVIDLSPEKYATMNYDDLLNNCDRISKVIKTSQLGIYSTSGLRKETKTPSDIEQQVRKITSESITATEQMSKELEKTPEIKSPEKVEESFEFEQAFEIEEVEKKEFDFEGIEKPEEKKEPKKRIFEKPEETEGALEVEREAPAEVEAPVKVQKEEKYERKELKPLQRALQRMREKKSGIITETPPILTAPEEPQNVFEEIRSTFNSEWGEERNEDRIKRKMIELTKELFREKLSTKREEIKRQITVLKNMLTNKEEKGAKGKKEVQYSSGLFSALAGTLDSEFASKMNSFSADAETKISSAKERFQDLLVEIPDDDKDAKKAALDKLVFDLTGIGEKMDADTEQFLEEIIKKHISAIEQFEQTLDSKDKTSREKAEETKDGLESKYKKEMELLKPSIHTRINAMIEDSSRGLIVSERKETKKEKDNEDVSVIINEIAEMDEGSLLFYLHAQDLNAYRNFEHKRISRQEAVNMARKLLAKDKGLGDAVINKHWGGI